MVSRILTKTPDPCSLSDSEDLDQVVQLVGKSALSDPDKITLDVSSLIKEDFLQQNGYSKHDQYCPVWKTLWMMKAMMAFYDESQKAVQAGVQWGKIRDATAEIQHQLRSMKFEASFPPYSLAVCGACVGTCVNRKQEVIGCADFFPRLDSG